MTMPAAVPPNPEPNVANPKEVICSAQKCRALAQWAVIWNNPKIHTPDREKTWSACNDHKDHLSEYLTNHRMNLIRVDPLGTTTA